MSLYRYSKIEKDYKYYLECTRLLPVRKIPHGCNPGVTPLLYPEEFTMTTIEQFKVLKGVKGSVLIILGNSMDCFGGYPYNVRLINIDEDGMLVYLSAVDKKYGYTYNYKYKQKGMEDLKCHC